MVYAALLSIASKKADFFKLGGVDNRIGYPGPTWHRAGHAGSLLPQQSLQARQQTHV